MRLSFCFVVLLMLISIGIDSQKIVLKGPELITPCSKGMRNGTDKYNITGTVGPNFTDFVALNWQSSISIQVWTKISSQFMEICLVIMGYDGRFCNPSSTSSCYCDHIDNITGAAHIVVTVEAQLSHSGGEVRGVWQHNNRTVIYSDKNLILPQIYDVGSATLKLTVNNERPVETSGSCHGTFTSAGTNTVKLCCSDTASPCYPRINISGIVHAENKPVVENEATCVNFTFVLHNDSYTANVAQSYSVCSASEVTVGSCMIEITSESNSTIHNSTAGLTSTTIAPTTVSTANTYVLADEEDCPVLKCVVPIVVVIGVLVVAGVIIGVICCKSPCTIPCTNLCRRKKRNKQVAADVERSKQSSEPMKHSDQLEGKRKEESELKEEEIQLEHDNNVNNHHAENAVETSSHFGINCPETQTTKVNNNVSENTKLSINRDIEKNQTGKKNNSQARTKPQGSQESGHTNSNEEASHRNGGQVELNENSTGMKPRHLPQLKVSKKGAPFTSISQVPPSSNLPVSLRLHSATHSARPVSVEETQASTVKS